MQLVTSKIPGLGKIEAQLTSFNLKECLNEIKKQGYTYINLNSVYGWEAGAPIDFLKDNDWIEGLWIVDVDEVMDLTPINYLNNLKYFGFSGHKYSGYIDFKNIPDLEYLVITWDKKMFKNFENCKNLKELHFYKWPHSDLKTISHFLKLEVLEIYFTKNLKILTGIENLKQLYRLAIYSGPHLADIGHLEFIAESLKKLSFELCPKIDNYLVLDSLKNLQSFYINRSSSLHSVQFIKALDNLRYAFIGVDILDGNIEILKDKKIKFKKSKLYKD